MTIYTESSKDLHKDEALWKGAIQDAEAEIHRAQRRIARLRKSIKVFKMKLLRGESWPKGSDDASTHN